MYSSDIVTDQHIFDSSYWLVVELIKMQLNISLGLVTSQLQMLQQTLYKFWTERSKNTCSKLDGYSTAQRKFRRIYQIGALKNIVLFEL